MTGRTMVWSDAMSRSSSGLEMGSKERRKSARRSVDACGWVRLDGGFAVRPCKVVNLSDGGVRISIKNAGRFPSMFAFSVSRRADAGRWVQTKWRDGSNIGGAFLS